MKLLNYPIDKKLLSVFLVISISILTGSFLNAGGCLSSDSGSYLLIAKNLVDGNGYTYTSYSPAYPVLITIISFVTNVSVFVASKISNILLLLINFLVLRRYYNKDTYLIVIIFMWGSYINNFFFTLTEAMFTTALICFSASIYEFIKKEKPSFTNYFFVLITMLILFFTRYIGAFSFGIVGIMALFYLYKKKYRIASILLGLIFISFAIMVFFLKINHNVTGYYTGMERIPPLESNKEFFIMFLKATLHELLIPLFSLHSADFEFSMYKVLLLCVSIIVVQIFFVFLILKKTSKEYFSLVRRQLKLFTIENVFFVVGLLYIVMITIMRRVSHFDDLSSRFFSPGSILIVFSIIGLLIKTNFFKEVKLAKKVLIFASFISLSFNTVYHIVNISFKVQEKNNTYFTKISNLQKQLYNLPKDSYVAFVDWHATYLRTDLVSLSPYYKPYYKKSETWSEFLKRIDKDYIYIDLKQTDWTLNYYDQTIKDEIKSLQLKNNNVRFYKYKCK